MTISPSTDKIEFLSDTLKAVIFVEHGFAACINTYLSQSNRTGDFIVIAGGGTTGVNCELLITLIIKEIDIPLIFLGDSDPGGYSNYFSTTYGGKLNNALNKY